MKGESWRGATAKRQWSAEGKMEEKRGRNERYGGRWVMAKG